MSSLSRLAGLLEEAARALRDADSRLSAIPNPEGTPLDPRKLSSRAVKKCRRSGILTVEQLEQRTVEDLLEIRGFGPGCSIEVRNYLRSIGKHLKGESA